MNPFPDKDLQSLKTRLMNRKSGDILALLKGLTPKLLSLIVRMEAAEKCAKRFEDIYPDEECCEAWRKSSGKEPK